MCKFDWDWMKACLVMSVLVMNFVSWASARAQEDGNNTVFFASLSGVAVLSIYDIMTAPGAVRHDNETVFEFPERAEARKTPSTALTWSLGTTLIPTLVGARIMQSTGDESGNRIGFVLVAIGMGIGPSTGHIYAGQTKRGIVTAVLRLGLGIVALATLDLSD